MPTILITGAKGQLAQELQQIQHILPNYKFLFFSKNELDITNIEQVQQIFNSHPIQVVINTAAYTQVDKAETNILQAQEININGTKNLAIACEKVGATLLHVSTDFVFDGTKNTPYLESDATNPLGIYGGSKYLGEQAALVNNPKTLIVRTSWLYSEFGHNFVKTMIKLATQHATLNVVYDQIGSPTYAFDLANALLSIVLNINKIKNYTPTQPNNNIYNFANLGVTSWYDFAVTIMQLSKKNCVVQPIFTAQYPTPAKRPAYSVLHSKKIQEDFNITIPYWKNSLEICLKKINLYP